MSGGVMSYTVIDANAHELLLRLFTSRITGTLTVFEAKSTDDPSDTPAIRHFEVVTETLHLDQEPWAANVIDQNNNWFQMIFHNDIGTIEFSIDNTH